MVSKLFVNLLLLLSRHIAATDTLRHLQKNNCNNGKCDVPTSFPTQIPTASPTALPTERPTGAPTSNPTQIPTQAPTQEPSMSPTTCDDQDACKIWSVDADGNCVYEDRVCDDGQEFTIDTCNPDTGCEHVCDDQNACTVESFDANGNCEPEIIDCYDGNPFTLDTCDPRTGCKFVAINPDLDFDSCVSEDAIFYEDAPTLSRDDEIAIIEWIKTEVTHIRTDFCWKQTYGRGVGYVLSECPSHKEKIGALCYSPCESGYSRQGIFIRCIVWTC